MIYRCEHCGAGVNPQGDAVVWRNRDMVWFENDKSNPERVVYVWHTQCYRENLTKE